MIRCRQHTGYASAAITARCAARTSRCSPARGRFTDDLNVPGQAYAVFVRAPVSHAGIRAVDSAAARAMPGVLGVFTGRDLVADGSAPSLRSRSFPAATASRCSRAAMPVLAVDRIRYVGEPVAIVVAETLAQAQDAAEAVRVDYRAAARARATSTRAIAPDAPAIWRGARPATSRSTGPTATRPRSSRVRPRRACRARAARRHAAGAESRWSRAPAIGMWDPRAGSATR